MEYTKESMAKLFKKHGTLKVTFTKANGDKRVMVCTKDMDKVPEKDHPKPLKEGEKPKVWNEGLCPVYELGVGWRSFYYAKVLDVEPIME